MNVPVTESFLFRSVKVSCGGVGSCEAKSGIALRSAPGTDLMTNDEKENESIKQAIETNFVSAFLMMVRFSAASEIKSKPQSDLTVSAIAAAATV